MSLNLFPFFLDPPTTPNTPSSEQVLLSNCIGQGSPEKENQQELFTIVGTGKSKIHRADQLRQDVEFPVIMR